MSLEQRRQAWSSYWASGNVDSCIGGLVERDDGAIKGFWCEVASGLVSGGRVLDIASGNGSLSRLLLDIRPGGICIDAVDVAALRPQWLGANDADVMRFHSGVAMEALPFASGTFDLVASQFGIEYGQWPVALEEAIRVCAPAGTIAFILHHADSLVVRLGGIEAAHQQWLLGRDGLLLAAERLVPHMARVMAGEAPDQQANDCRQAYNQAMSELARRLDSEAPDLLIHARDRVHATLASVRDGNVSDCSGYLADFRRELHDAALRTRELLQCALTSSQVEALAVLFEERLAGRHVRIAPLVEGETVLGWGVLAVAC